MKICKNCKENKSLDDFYKMSKSICKKCYLIRRKQYRDKRKIPKIIPPGLENKKQCSNCKLYKEKTDFGLLNKSLDKLSYSCKECLYSRINKWGLKNKSKVKKAKKKWKKNNKDASRAYERNKRKIDKNFQLKTYINRRNEKDIE